MRALVEDQGFSLIEILAVVALIGVVAAMTIPITAGALSAHRLKGDAQSLRNTVGLAKMRASSGFTRARVRVDLNTSSYVLEIWDRTNGVWLPDGGTSRTSTGVRFGSGDRTTPPHTLVSMAMSPACTTGVDATANEPLDSTACVIFNSRGLPVDSVGALFPRHALYLTGETGVYAMTVTATPLIRSWWSPVKEAEWTAQ